MFERLKGRVSWELYEMKCKLTEGKKVALDVAKVISSDVKVEGHKRGYTRAAKEYEAAFCRVQKEYNETKAILDNQIVQKDREASQLFLKLKELQERKAQIEVQIDEKSKKISEGFNIPISTVAGVLKTGKSIAEIPYYSRVGTIYLVYKYKKKKLDEAEVKGYEEARKIYELKMKELLDNLNRLKDKGHFEMQQFIELISDVLTEITEAELKIAELEIVLKG